MGNEVSVHLKGLRKEAENEAQKLRYAYNLGNRGIGDIFKVIEQSLGYLLIRYPFGESEMEGFSAAYQDMRLVVTNSSYILSRERFTAAHEIGHHILYFRDQTSKIKTDQAAGHYNEMDPVEFQADCFAAAFLMPRDGIESVIYEMELDTDDMGHVDVVRLQVEFGVSYSAMIRRLTDLGIVDKDQANYLYRYWEETGDNLERLFRRAQAPSNALLHPFNQVWVPNKYLRYLEANYESDLISHSVLQKILGVIKVNPEDWGFDPKLLSTAELETDEDIDALIKELEDEV